ncbi:hypothetical protein [Candidatus Lariskella endosymbiont of Epinotia ramella]
MTLYKTNFLLEEVLYGTDNKVHAHGFWWHDFLEYKLIAAPYTFTYLQRN